MGITDNDRDQASAVCNLAMGQLLEWRGLRPFPVESMPACLGRQESAGWLQLGREYTAYQVLRSGESERVVWLFIFSDERVHLVEVFPASASTHLDTVLSEVDAPDLEFEYPVAARLQRLLGEADEELLERVYSQIGLAILIGQVSEQPPRLIRLRGFEPMPAREYKARFVDLPPIRFFER